jgi:aminopeptidase
VQDPRVEAYAKLLVETCVEVQPGWQVLIRSTPLARPLIEEVVRLCARRGAYALLRLQFADAMDTAWAEEAPEDLLRELAPVERHALEHIDAAVVISAPENMRDGSSVSPERQQLVRQAMEPLLARLLSQELPWVGCQYPTPALAQEAGMTLAQFEDFLYGACLLDWDDEAQKMQRIAERFDRADEVRIVGEETDLSFSLAGRHGKVDAGGANVPGGEVFYSPVEDSTEGVITFAEYPAVLTGNVCERVRLEFRNGRVVEASAATGEPYLLAVLDTDEGARVLGEFGIGCNPGIQRHMKNTLFDEKIYGTIHLAVGAGFPFLGGQNKSVVHWDMVKDLRNGGRILCDGEVVQESGEWRF